MFGAFEKVIAILNEADTQVDAPPIDIRPINAITGMDAGTHTLFRVGTSMII